jgi:hypothetical protein
MPRIFVDVYPSVRTYDTFTKNISTGSHMCVCVHIHLFWMTHNWSPPEEASSCCAGNPINHLLDQSYSVVASVEEAPFQHWWYGTRNLGYHTTSPETLIDQAVPIEPAADETGEPPRLVFENRRQPPTSTINHKRIQCQTKPRESGCNQTGSSHENFFSSVATCVLLLSRVPSMSGPPWPIVSTGTTLRKGSKNFQIGRRKGAAFSRTSVDPRNNSEGTQGGYKRDQKWHERAESEY